MEGQLIAGAHDKVRKALGTGIDIGLRMRAASTEL